MASDHAPSLLRRRWLRRLLIAAVATPAVIVLLGFLILPPIVRHVAAQQLTSLLGRRVTLDRVRMNLFALSLSVENLQIYERDGVTPFLGFARFHVNVEAASLYRRGPVVRELRLESLRAHLVRETASADPLAGYNFSDVVKRLTAGPATPPAAPGPPPRFSFNNIRVTDGLVTFDDRPTRGHHELAGLEVGVPFVSTLPVFVDTFVEPGLRVRVDGSPFALVGRTKPFKDSLETTLELRIAALDLTRLVPYVPVRLPVEVASALLDVGLDLSFVRPRADAPSLSVSGRVALDKLDVRDGKAPLLRLDQLEVKVRKADITGQRFAVERVGLTGLELHVRRSASGKLNLQRLADALPSPPPKPRSAPNEPPPRFEVTELAVRKAAVHWHDESVHPAMTVAVEPISVTVRGLSNAPGAQARTAVEIHASPGGTLEEDGTLSLAPLAAAGTVTLEGLEPARLAPYYREQILFDVTKGRLRLGAGYRFEQKGADARVSLADAYVELADLALHRRSDPAKDDFFRLGTLAVREVAVDLARQSASVGLVSARDGKLRLERDAKGAIDLASLAAPAPPSPPPSGAATPWSVSLAKLDLDGWSVRFTDRAVEPPAVLTAAPLAIKVAGYSTAPGTRVTYDVKLGLNQKGRVGISGSARLEPLLAAAKVDLAAIDLLALQPYFADQVKMTVSDGAVSVKGQLEVAVPAAKKGPAPPPRVRFTGDAAIDGFACVDRAGDELVKWRTFKIDGLAMDTEPFQLTAREIALRDLLSRVVLLPDGSLNLESAFAAPKPETPPKPAPPSSAPPPVITIGQVTIEGGRVSFSDRTISPAYSTDLADLAARFTGLSSQPGTQADIDVRGRFDAAGRLTVAGKINPLAKELFADVKVDLEDFELPPTSPYAGKYAGYSISKGKLGLSLAYHIANSKLDARNRVVIEQFDFGDKVKSADATGLPVRLAVALLKDRRGVIDVELPVAGSLDDPQFKVGRAILKVLGNLIVKAATAPFSLIASAFGGGEQLSSIEFPAGAAALDASARSKVQALGRALRERPGLSFEIEGGADPDRDAAGLRRYLFERKLRAQRMLELVKAGSAVPSVDDVRIDPADQPRLLEKAYDAETFPKPRNFLGAAKSLPPAEMEKLMLAHVVVAEDALLNLAQRRAAAVREALAGQASTQGARLFLVAPKISARPGNRVELRLKND